MCFKEDEECDSCNMHTSQLGQTELTWSIQASQSVLFKRHKFQLTHTHRSGAGSWPTSFAEVEGPAPPREGSS
eukprot:14076907-Alexandrium_andersonii.AAC.1